MPDTQPDDVAKLSFEDALAELDQIVRGLEGGTLDLTSERTPTSTEVTSSDNPALPGEKATFTATVGLPAGSSPFVGTVQFVPQGQIRLSFRGMLVFNLKSARRI